MNRFQAQLLASTSFFLGILATFVGCSPPFAYLPDTTALERYYSRDVRSEDLSLLPKGHEPAQGRKTLWSSITLTSRLPDDPKLPAPESADFVPAKNVLTFLHVSDAHVRDESVYGPGYEDKLRVCVEAFKAAGQAEAAGAALRPRLVERWAALRLAGFVTAASKRGIPYVIFTGDLCDMSLLSEVRLGLAALEPRHPTSQIPPTTVHTVAGNHDGFFFGNLRLDYTDPSPDKEGMLAFQLNQLLALVSQRFNEVEPRTYHLGLTKTEFVLTHLLADENGYGFQAAEAFMNIGTLAPPDAMSRVPRAQKEQTLRDYVRGCRIRDIHTRSEDDRLATLFGPLDGLRKAIGCDLRGRIGADLPDPPADDLETHGFYVRGPHDPNKVDPRTLTEREKEPNGPGAYYAFDMIASSRPQLRIRAIALDTRACRYAHGCIASNGDINDEQLAWFKSELHNAHESGTPVLIVAHHPPDQNYFNRSKQYQEFRSLLHHYHDIIIGYFCGHTHENWDYWLRRPTWLNSDPRIEPATAHLDAYAKEESLLVVQTGSTCEFPHVGRLVTISQESGAISISWRFADLAAEENGAECLRDALLESQLAAEDFPEPATRSTQEREFRKRVGELRKRWSDLDKRPPAILIPFHELKYDSKRVATSSLDVAN